MQGTKKGARCQHMRTITVMAGESMPQSFLVCEVWVAGWCRVRNSGSQMNPSFSAAISDGEQ